MAQGKNFYACASICTVHRAENLLKKGAAWKEFSDLVMAMVPQKEKRRNGLGSGKITFGLPVLGGLLNPKMDVAFTLENGEKEERNFYDLIEETTDAFCPLIWNYIKTTSFRHPIMEILLKRIELTERLNGVEYATREELQRSWFPERIDTTDPVSFILNHNWSKPRDVVRLISAAQDSLHFEATAFNQAVLESSMPQYSRNSLTELREELRALYSAQEIDDIFNCFTGFVDTFTLDKLRKQVQDYFPHSVLATRTLDVLNDLYRLGIIGNFHRTENRYRWQYRGDDRIILNDEWLITIHRGLRKALTFVDEK